MDNNGNDTAVPERILSSKDGKASCFVSFPPHFSLSALNEKARVMKENYRRIRQIIVGRNLFSIWILLLAMPTFGIMIQCGLFLFGKTCSAFPMWFSFLLFSILSLLIHWKKLVILWGLTFLGLFLSAYTFSYYGIDAELYHVPMQMLLREGWNPIFDSSIQKFDAIANTSSFFAYHTLFLPKTIALCGALVAKASGLWIANSFLGYLLLFVMLGTSFVFADKMWKCGRVGCLLFAASISFNSIMSTLFDGLIDFHLYAALIISAFSLVLYLQYDEIHDLILAVIASAICCTTKTTGLINCMVLWGAFCLYSWKKKETYLSAFAVVLLVVWIGLSPFVTSWIQYGSPFYPLMTFDPKITPVDITDDFFANADGNQMGYIARFVYAWISPGLAKKACAIYYHKADFDPVFNLQVTRGVGGYGISLNCLFLLGIVLLVMAKKNLVSVLCLFFLLTLVLCPVKYVGYERYFPQAWIVFPLGVYHFCTFPPAWFAKREIMKKVFRYCLYSILCLFTFFSVAFLFAYQERNMIIEGRRQVLLASIQKEGMTFDIPQNSTKGFTVFKRLVCGNVNCSFSEQTLDMSPFRPGRYRSIDLENSLFIRYKQYYYISERCVWEYYPFDHNPSTLLRFKWLDIFKYFPRPLFYRETPQSSVIDTRKNDKPLPFFQKQ